MSECCSDLFELRELLEEMPAEFEAQPLWSCRVENEGFALQKEPGGEGLELKYGREIWVDLPSACPGPCVLDFCFSYHPSAAPYQILSLFH